MIGLAVYGTFIWVPNEKTMGFLQRIFYFHAASGEVMILAFCVVFIGNVGYLIRRKPEWDWLATSGVEVGLVFNTISLVTGPIWAKPAWGIWWDWDARLTSTFVLWILYISYLLLRRLIENPEKRAVVLPLCLACSLFSTFRSCIFQFWWWRTQHPYLR